MTNLKLSHVPELDCLVLRSGKAIRISLIPSNDIGARTSLSLIDLRNLLTIRYIPNDQVIILASCSEYFFIGVAPRY